MILCSSKSSVLLEFVLNFSISFCSFSVLMATQRIFTHRSKINSLSLQYFSSVSNGSFDHIVEKICSIINKEQAWGPSVERSISSRVPNIHPRLVFRVLKQEIDPKMACGLFYWASKRPKFVHNQFTYCALIEVLAKDKDFDHIWKLINEMYECNIELSCVPFTTLINGYANIGLFHDAKNAFDAISRFKIEPNLYAYNALLNAYVMSCKISEALESFYSMCNAGFTPDVVTYTTLINGLCRAGECEKAFEVLDDMRKNGCEPNKLTYTSFIQGLILVNKGSDAITMLGTMLKNGCFPDTVTYNSLLEWCSRIGKFDKVMELLEQMDSIQCKPNALTYGIVINGLFEARRFELALSMVKKMIGNQCNPNTQIYNALNTWLCMEATSEEGIEFMDWVVEKCQDLSGFSYVILMENMLKSQRADLVHTTFMRMLAKGYRPDKSICTALINWLCRQGRTDEVLKLLEILSETQKESNIASVY